MALTNNRKDEGLRLVLSYPLGMPGETDPSGLFDCVQCAVSLQEYPGEPRRIRRRSPEKSETILADRNSILPGACRSTHTSLHDACRQTFAYPQLRHWR